MQQDCLGCRVVGVGSLWGASGYLVAQRAAARELKQRRFLGVGAALFFAVGAYRMVLDTRYDPF